MEEREYKVGEQALYLAAREIYRIRVIESNSDDNYLRYRLKVIEVKQTEKPNKNQIGREFECEKPRTNKEEKMWKILDK